MTGCRPRARLISITCRWRNGVALVRSCAIYRKRDGLKCGMRYSLRAVLGDQAIEAAKQALPRNDRSELSHARSPGVARGIEIRRSHFDSSAARPSGFAEPERSGAWSRNDIAYAYATEFCNCAESSAMAATSPFFGFIFALDICNMPSPLFTSANDAKLTPS